MIGTAGMAAELARALREAGTRVVFGVPGGGSNLDMVGAAEAAGMRFVLTHTETAAAIMAGVAGELTGTPGACVVTRGPGAASAVNGVAQTLLDRQPMVLVTDCVPAAQRDRVSHQRLDQATLLGAVAKRSVVYTAATARATAEAAVALATAAPPGPVHLDVDAAAAEGWPPAEAPPGPPDVGPARDLLGAARRPVVVAGVGAAPAAGALRRLVAGTRIPVLATYKAKGVVGDSSPHAAGLVTGAIIEAPLLQRADLILGVGLDPVELIPAAWPYAAPVVLAGSWAIEDSTYFGDRLTTQVVGDLGMVLDELAGSADPGWRGHEAQQARRAGLDAVAAAVPARPAAVVPQDVVTVARRLAPPGTVATVDAGAHMLVAMPLWDVEEPGEVLISSGLATMGFAVPAAVAAALVRPGRRVLCFTGDGGLGMALAELETMVRLGLQVTVVVFNDALLSLIAVKQCPESQGGDRAVRYGPTDFAALAHGCGMAAWRAGDTAGYERALAEALACPGPSLIDVAVDPGGYGSVIAAIRGL
jgi:acetolactate synthase-1/2/3 large subunit